MIELIIMASGFSRRMGANKLLLPLGGRPLIAWVISAAKASAVGRVTVVCADDAVADIARGLGATVLMNPLAAQGQSAGVRLAVSEAAGDVEGYLFLAGDQPLISAEALQALAARHQQSGAEITSALWLGKRRLPVLFRASMRTALLALEGDQGGRALIDSGCYPVSYLDLPSEQEAWDVDTPEDLKQLEMWLHDRHKT